MAIKNGFNPQPVSELSVKLMKGLLGEKARGIEPPSVGLVDMPEGITHRVGICKNELDINNRLAETDPAFATAMVMRGVVTTNYIGSLCRMGIVNCDGKSRETFDGKMTSLDAKIYKSMVYNCTSELVASLFERHEQIISHKGLGLDIVARHLFGDQPLWEPFCDARAVHGYIKDAFGTGATNCSIELVGLDARDSMGHISDYMSNCITLLVLLSNCGDITKSLKDLWDTPGNIIEKLKGEEWKDLEEVILRRERQNALGGPHFYR
ncbi:MAG: hypothetical protein KGH98_04450 [Candidatus Micrarchaeota archaeon]|nr:hypothetical protein [Candidatus Micrarchaeota archaeon]MDE1857296.1 hypothetical protein [Candidatus Micrarchaeota archaeon]